MKNFKKVLVIYKRLLYNSRRQRRQKSIAMLCSFDAFCSQKDFELFNYFVTIRKVKCKEDVP